MKNLCVILSAVDNEYGIYSHTQRFNQLCKSVESAQQLIPNVDILLIDSSDKKPKWKIEGAESHYVGDYINVDLSKIKDDTSNKSFKKTVGEVFSFSLALELISSRQYRHVFKLAGRYQINQNFIFSNHISKSINVKKYEMYGDLVYLTRLWSFDFFLLPYIKTLYNDIFLNMYNNPEKIEIIELAMYNQINRLKIPVNELPSIGVEGHFGQDGAYVID